MKKLLLSFSLILAFTSLAWSSTYYISPTGSDAAAGTSGAPWKTFAYALASARLMPGDTLYLKNGTYSTAAGTGLPSINCSSGYNNGTAVNPITIQAENERHALIQGNGIQTTFLMTGCSYWVIRGIRMQSQDNAGGSGQLFYIINSNHITIRRNIFAYHNRYFNTLSFALENSNDSLVEENEMYYFFRNGFTAFGNSNRNIFRRNYANGRNYADIAGGYISGATRTADTGYTVYPGSNNIFENNISEGNGAGFDIEPAGTTSGNSYMGNISLNDETCFFAQARGSSLSYMARDTTITDHVCIGATGPGFNMRTTKNTRITNASVFGTGTYGAVADQQSGPETGDSLPTIFFKNVLSSGRKSTADFYFVNQNDFLCDYCAGISTFRPVVSDSHITNEFLSVPTNLDGYYVWIPATSNLKAAGRDGADIGANILYRYINGALTTESLWNPGSGAFPCGAIVPGLTDVSGSSCFDVHVRLNVSATKLPPGYGGSSISVSAPTNLRVLKTTP